MRQYTPAQRIEQARLFIVTQLHYYASVMYRLHVHEDPTCRTAWTDGDSIGYNPTWLGMWTIPQIIGTFIHEVEHVILKHPLREEMAHVRKEDHFKANVAMDYALNPLVLKHRGVELPDGLLIDLDRWPDDTFEKIFSDLDDDEVDKLKKQCEGQGIPQPGDGDGGIAGGNGIPGFGEVRPYKKGKASGAAKDAKAQEIDQWVHAAGMKAQNAGTMTESLKQRIQGLTTPAVRWEDELTFLCECICKNDYTWSRPNPRYMSTGCYLPTMHGYSTPDMLFFVDTSGSLDDSQIVQIKSEIRAILSTFTIRVIVVYWDTEYEGCEVFDSTDVFDPAWELNITGRGGTQFSKVLNWLDEPYDENGEDLELDFDPKAIIFFSDLECSNYPDTEPELPWLWVQLPYSGHFGESYIKYLPDWGKHVLCHVYST